MSAKSRPVSVRGPATPSRAARSGDAHARLRARVALLFGVLLVACLVITGVVALIWG